MNAGFLAVAVTAATALVAPDRKAGVLAVLLGGTTVACVAGVPGGALLLVLGLGALVNGATFCTFSYLAPVVTDTARLGLLCVPVVLAAFGVCSFAGVSIAGRLADRHPAAAAAY